MTSVLIGRRLVLPCMFSFLINVALYAQEGGGGPGSEDEDVGCTEECSEPTPPGFEIIAHDGRNIRGVNFIPPYASMVAYDANNLPAPRAVVPAADTIDLVDQIWTGSSSPTAYWWAYDRLPLPTSQIPIGTAPYTINGLETRKPINDIDTMLDTLQALGVNSIRVWLSFPLWRFYKLEKPGQPNKMIDNFADFVARCRQRYIYVVPVVWDMFGADNSLYPEVVTTMDDAFSKTEDAAPLYFPITIPSHGRLRGEWFRFWHNSPGNDIVYTFSGSFNNQPTGVLSVPHVDPPRTITIPPGYYGQMRDYVQELVWAVQSDWSTILFWDVMNEGRTANPETGEPFTGVRDFLVETAKLIKDIDVNAWVIHGGLTVSGNANSGYYFTDPPPGSTVPDEVLFDGIGFQGYTTSRVHVEAQIEGFIEQGGAGDPLDPTDDKLLVSVEAGGGVLAEEAIHWLSCAKRPDLGPDEQGVGFFIFQAFTSVRGGNLIYPEAGFLLPTGQIIPGFERHALAIRDLAINRDGQSWLNSFAVPSTGSSQTFAYREIQVFGKGDMCPQLLTGMTIDLTQLPSTNYDPLNHDPNPQNRLPLVGSSPTAADWAAPSEETVKFMFEMINIAHAVSGVAALDRSASFDAVSNEWSVGEFYAADDYPNNRWSNATILEDLLARKDTVNLLKEHYTERSYATPQNLPLTFSVLMDQLDILRRQYVVTMLRRRFDDAGDEIENEDLEYVGKYDNSEPDADPAGPIWPPSSIGN